MWIGIWILSGVSAGILTESVRKDWCPLLSYTGNLRRLGEALLDTESAIHKFRNLFPRPDEYSGTFPGPQPPGNRQSRIVIQSTTQPSRFERRPLPTAPWSWCALTLAGVFGISLWTLTFRVKSLDRLR
jgi:ABC-2 type transport system permease protein